MEQSTLWDEEELLETLPSLPDDLLLREQSARPRRVYKRACYLCGARAEGKCEDCGQRICWLCGVGWSWIHRNALACNAGFTCPNALYRQWCRHQYTMENLLVEDADYFTRECLVTFLAQHEVLWAWATKDDEQRTRCRMWDGRVKRDYQTALRRCRKYLDKPLKKGA